MTGPRGPLVALLVAVVVVSVLTGCGIRAGGTSSAAPPVSTTPTSRTASTLATSPGPTTLGPAPGPGEVSMAEAVTALDARIGVHDGPGGPVTQTFTNPQPSGAPLTFLLKRQDGDWLQVYLPVRPNGSTGWVRTIDVAQAPIPYRLEISKAAHQLRLYRGNQLLHTYPRSDRDRWYPNSAGPVLPHRAFGAYQLRLRALRLRPVGVLRRAYEFRWRSRPNRPARHPGRRQHRTLRQSRLHPAQQHRYHGPGQTAAPRHPRTHHLKPSSSLIVLWRCPPAGVPVHRVLGARVVRGTTPPLGALRVRHGAPGCLPAACGATDSRSPREGSRSTALVRAAP